MHYCNLDPFGHSATQAALLSAEVGFTALYFSRMDYQDTFQRRATQDLEFMWRASPSLGAAAQVFAGKFVGGYGPLEDFDYDVSEDRAKPIQDDPNIQVFHPSYCAVHHCNRYIYKI